MPREKRLIQITGRTQYQNFTEWQQHNSGGLPREENLDFLVDYDIVDRQNNFASIHNRGIEVIRTAGIFTVAFLSLEREDRFRLRKGQHPTLIGASCNTDTAARTMPSYFRPRMFRQPGRSRSPTSLKEVFVACI